MTDNTVEVKKASAPAGAPSSPDVWQSFRSDMERLFDRFSTGFGLPSLRRMLDVAPGWTYQSSFGLSVPAIDLSEDDKAYQVSAELPGMSEKDLEVTVSGDMLVVKGEKRQEKEEKDKNFYISERSYGSFQRSIALPAGIDRDAIEAQFANGVLTVRMPKTEAAQKQSKKIEVKPA